MGNIRNIYSAMKMDPLIKKSIDELWECFNE